MKQMSGEKNPPCVRRRVEYMLRRETSNSAGYKSIYEQIGGTNTGLT